MRILWVKVGGLWPPNFGGRIRSFHILKELSRQHRVSVLTSHAPGESVADLADHLPACERVASFPHTAPKLGTSGFVRSVLRSWLSPLPVDVWRWRIPALRRAVDHVLSQREADLCIADFLVAIPNIPLTNGIPLVLFSHNVEHMIWMRLRDVETRPWHRLALEIEWRKMRRYEARACAQARMTLAVSELDRSNLSALAPAALIRTIPTGVDTTYFAPNTGQEAPGHLVFTGAMDWHPNEDGILHFIEQVLPRIRQGHPEVTLTVVGRNPSRSLVSAAAKAGVEVTGIVEDVRPYLAKASVYVVPLRIGGGTRLKIYEALAMGKAVVSTSVGAEGLPLEPGIDYVRADEPAEFARAVLDLIRDSARRAQLGATGRRLVEERYSWAEVARCFAKHCEEVVAHNAH